MSEKNSDSSQLNCSSTNDSTNSILMTSSNQDKECGVPSCSSKEELKCPVEKSYGFKEDLSLWVKFKAPLVGEIRFNPIVTFFAVLVIWGFVVWGCVEGRHGRCFLYGRAVPFGAWKTWTIDYFTWLYIGSVDAWLVFVVAVYFSKYGNLKLGKPDEKPEFSDLSWFVMLFACGVGIGMFFYGVAEAVVHYTTRNRYYADGTLPDNTLAQIAINITLFHWGIHGWVVYTVVGMLLGLMSFREGLPLTMKSCFYPLMGNSIFGWMGDVIDSLCIMSILFGVCTSLGLGTRQLNAGLSLVIPSVPSDNLNIQVIIIWSITFLATGSTVSGIGAGIRRLSELCFALGMFLMLTCFVMDNSVYILNLLVQSLGYYMQHLIQLGTHTDVFEQLGSSKNGLDRERLHYSSDGPSDWMDSWTMFYWGMWIGWSPFVGMFIAKISRGRTIREFIHGTLTAPVIYSFLWMILFGGIGIRHEREAGNYGLCCNTPEPNSGFFLTSDQLSLHLARNNMSNSPVQHNTTSWMCQSQNCNTCALSTINRYAAANTSYGQLVQDYQLLGRDFGSTLADRTHVKLSCHKVEQMWFDVMRSYPGIGHFLPGFSLVAMVLYFITTSDSGSLVIDCLSANGDPDPPRIQRVFWALTEGMAATALLATGGSNSLSALQTAIVVIGLPCTLLVSLACVAIWRTARVATGEMDPRGPKFECGLFDCWFSQPIKRLKWRNTSRLFVKFLTNIFMGPVTISSVAAKLNKFSKAKNIMFTATATTFLGGFVLCHVLGPFLADNIWAIGWFFYVAHATLVTTVRLQARKAGGIEGHVFEDFFASLLFYPNVAVQLDETVDVLITKEKIIINEKV